MKWLGRFLGAFGLYNIFAQFDNFVAVSTIIKFVSIWWSYIVNIPIRNLGIVSTEILTNLLVLYVIIFGAVARKILVEFRVRGFSDAKSAIALVFSEDFRTMTRGTAGRSTVYAFPFIMGFFIPVANLIYFNIVRAVRDVEMVTILTSLALLIYMVLSDRIAWGGFRVPAFVFLATGKMIDDRWRDIFIVLALALTIFAAAHTQIPWLDPYISARMSALPLPPSLITVD